MEKSLSEDNSVEVAILDYGMGNLRSVLRAWEAVGASAKIISDPSELKNAKSLVFPGQGAIQDTIKLLESTGWDKVIKRWIEKDNPFFGICLGLQALFERSEEGDTPCLGIFKGKIVRFNFSSDSSLKIPHMGWNSVAFKSSDLLQDLDSKTEQFYFVHSYYLEDESPDLAWGKTTYGELTFCSAIRQGNLVATQFHPEKSQRVGLRLYRNFLEQIIRQ